jgi:hypothetical protein
MLLALHHGESFVSRIVLYQYYVACFCTIPTVEMYVYSTVGIVQKQAIP